MSLINNLTAIEISQPMWLYLYSIIALILLTSKNITGSNLLNNIHVKHHYRHTYYSVIKKCILSNSNILKNKDSFFKNITYIIIIGFIFFSLSAPYIKGKQLPPAPDNRDILFVVDNEVSMVLQDYFIDDQRVERLTMVKSVLLNFAQKLAGNRIGIITFSERAYTLLPLTTDSNLIKKMIPRLETTLTGRTSNPQRALIYTLNYLHNLRDTSSKMQKPIIVLITDILRPPRDTNPNTVAEYIKKEGYKLFVVAIGASAYNKTDVENSTLIYHPASFERLKEMAKFSDGDFYWAKSTNSLNEIIYKILKTKKSKVSQKKQYEVIPLFHWPLLAALILLIIQYLSQSIHFKLKND